MFGSYWCILLTVPFHSCSLAYPPNTNPTLSRNLFRSNAQQSPERPITWGAKGIPDTVLSTSGSPPPAGGSRARKESDSTHVSWSLPCRQRAQGLERSSWTQYSIDLTENTVHRNEDFCMSFHETNQLEGETTTLKTGTNSILKSIMEYHLLYFFF